MYTFLLLLIVVALSAAVWCLSRALTITLASDRINADRIGWMFAWVGAVSAALGVVLRLLVHSLD